MDERLQFVARRLAGEAMTELCREFGISRKTGYKIFDRYQECAVADLCLKNLKLDLHNRICATDSSFADAITIDIGAEERIRLVPTVPRSDTAVLRQILLAG